MNGMLEPTSGPCAMARIAGIKLCERYDRRYGTDCRSVTPTSLYGPGDNDHPGNSHVIPALLRRFHEAPTEAAPEVVIRGSGMPMHAFLYVDHMAAASVHVMGLAPRDDAASTERMHSHINVGTGQDVAIAGLARLVGRAVGHRGNTVVDASRPGAAPRKLLAVSKLAALGWRASTPLAKGLQRACAAYLDARCAMPNREGAASSPEWQVSTRTAHA